MLTLGVRQRRLGEQRSAEQPRQGATAAHGHEILHRDPRQRSERLSRGKV
jgi:hypothetical protein